jgi:ATP-dependent Clp protease, protease subunit
MADEILIYEKIGDGGITAKAIKQSLFIYPAAPIRINSFGGDFFEGLAIYNTVKDAKRTTIIDSIAGGIAAVIAMAGTTIQIKENAFIQLSESFSASVGTADDFVNMHTILRNIDAIIKDIFEQRLKTDEDISAFMFDNSFINAEDCLKMGLVDKIID